MPRYDFKCGPCNSVVELQKSYTDKTPELCELCGNEMARQMSIPGIQFKGSGFYSTDNRKK